MCTRFITPEQAEIERNWHIGRHNPSRWWKAEVFPRKPGPFIRLTKDSRERELVVGHWSLVPTYERTLPCPTAPTTRALSALQRP